MYYNRRKRNQLQVFAGIESGTIASGRAFHAAAFVPGSGQPLNLQQILSAKPESLFLLSF
jgi:hypothetical protein